MNLPFAIRFRFRRICHRIFFVSVLDFDTADTLGSFLQKGRAANEALSLLDTKDVYHDNEHLFLTLFSYQDHKYFECDVTSTLESGMLSCRESVILGGSHPGTITATSCRKLHDGRVILLNSNQVGEIDYMKAPPVYDVNSGDRSAVCKLFNDEAAKKAMGDHNLDKAAFSIVDAINPERTRLAFAWTRFSMIGIWSRTLTSSQAIMGCT